jgi:hypothetical protein
MNLTFSMIIMYEGMCPEPQLRSQVFESDSLVLAWTGLFLTSLRLSSISGVTAGTGKLLLIYICNFHVLSDLLLIYICKLHWN